MDFFKNLFAKKKKALTFVELRNTSDDDGTRNLHATLDAAGNITLEGRDYGDGVERVLGCREYEWVWTIAADDVPKLLAALGAQDDVLAALQQRFSGNEAGGIAAFLETNGIAVQHWSRIGD